MRGLILGAGSGIARAVWKELATRGERAADWRFALRDPASAPRDFTEEQRSSLLTVDAFDDPAAVLSELERQGMLPDHVLMAWGVLVDEESGSPEAFKLQLEVNHAASIRWLGALAQLLDQQHIRGHFAVLGSVAGDRIRNSNRHYGLSKQALERDLEALRNAWPSQCFTLVKPGPVRTAMTAELSPPPPLMVSADSIAPRLVDEWLAGRPVSYLPRRWRWIMGILQLIPEFLWKRLPL